jgi:endonuclease/exonuclease/phosphatase (EEP) superfamily protein YafD
VRTPSPHSSRRQAEPVIRALAYLALLPLLTSCFAITADPRALVVRSAGTVEVRTLHCNGEELSVARPATSDSALDTRAIRVLTWNIHKQGDAGWEQDLQAFANRYDILLLQEVVLQRPLRDIVETAGLQWIMASSFFFATDDIGVLTAARIAPLASCTQRVVEPLIRLPKSAVIAWFALAGSEHTLAVANVHAINFSLSLEAYRSQLRDLERVLSSHRGPLILAGDLNTWTDARTLAVREVADRLGLIEITFAPDKRSLFFGQQLDHIFIRGLEMIESSSIPVTSSDHNPVAATLRVTER